MFVLLDYSLLSLKYPIIVLKVRAKRSTKVHRSAIETKKKNSLNFVVRLWRENFVHSPNPLALEEEEEERSIGMEMEKNVQPLAVRSRISISPCVAIGLVQWFEKEHDRGENKRRENFSQSRNERERDADDHHRFSLMLFFILLLLRFK